MDSTKTTFDDLNSFVDKYIQDLLDYENLFQNQVIGMNGLFNAVYSNKTKLEYLAERLSNLKLLQKTIDVSLEWIHQSKENLETILNSFESNYNKDLDTAPFDEIRAGIYRTAGEVFTILKNCHDKISDLEQTTETEDYHPDSMMVLFKILDGNLRSLEKLSLHIQRLQTDLSYNEHLLKQA